VDDALAGADQIIGNDAPVTAPPQNFGAHRHGASRTPQFSQPFENSPETITRRNRPELLTSQSTKFCDVSIIDLKETEAIGKGFAVKLGVGIGTRYVPDVDDDLDFVCAQHFDEIQQCASGMSNGKKAVGHLSQRLAENRFARVRLRERASRPASLRLDEVPALRSMSIRTYSSRLVPVPPCLLYYLVALTWIRREILF